MNASRSQIGLKTKSRPIASHTPRMVSLRSGSGVVLVIVRSFLLAVRVAMPTDKQWLCQWLIRANFPLMEMSDLGVGTNSGPEIGNLPPNGGGKRPQPIRT